MNTRLISLAFFVSTIVIITACGGGGGSSPTPSAPGGGATAAPTASPTPTTVSGTVMQIPSDAYGPTTIAGVTYQSADATQTSALANATVVIGPVPITGPTAPATLPSGDVAATTSATGAFTATIAPAPAAPSASEPFVLPSNNITNFAPPTTGYYFQVFGTGTDGKSAGVPIPLHRFLAAGTSIALHVSSTTTAEAGALVALNSDRANNGAGALTFDESAEEAARLHASDNANQQYACHYDLHNVGPTSRYLQVGGIGLTGESIGGSAGTTTAAQGFAQVEADFMAEKTQTPPGGHYENNVDISKLWAGLAAETNPSWVGTQYQGDYDVDYELITPNNQGAYGGASSYEVSPPPGCPNGTTDNGS